MDNKISVRTVRRRLCEFGLNGHVARKKPYISEKNRKARLKFAKEHIDWTQEQWSKVIDHLFIFTDESSIGLVLMGKHMYDAELEKNSKKNV